MAAANGLKVTVADRAGAKTLRVLGDYLCLDQRTELLK